ncbi:hypothetical protein C8Q74DRAFT_1282433 [Fomes fomentarius]|nr:hypothetical protein C8Q74DRAFT_1282433 [Fomes fomentarius]
MTWLTPVLHTRQLVHRVPEFAGSTAFTTEFMMSVTIEGPSRATDSTTTSLPGLLLSSSLFSSRPISISSISSISSHIFSTRSHTLPLPTDVVRTTVDPSPETPVPSVSSPRAQTPSDVLPIPSPPPKDSAESIVQYSQSLTASAFTQTQTITQVNDPIITSTPQQSLSGGAIAGIAVGTALLAALLAVFLVLFYLRRRHRQEGSGKPESFFTGGGKSGDGDNAPSDSLDIPPDIPDTVPSLLLDPSSDVSDHAIIAESNGVNPASTLEKPDPIGAAGSPPRLHEIDGGVRLAGGRPGSALPYDDEDALSRRDDDGSTLPPPYSEVRY